MLALGFSKVSKETLGVYAEDWGPVCGCMTALVGVRSKYSSGEESGICPMRGEDNGERAGVGGRDRLKALRNGAAGRATCAGAGLSGAGEAALSVDGEVAAIAGLR